ncbi:hypothetical protein KAI32_00215 [Candidatus Pacearchaeota archaeon]|nr:hypothetical protein [Candidatus Pacearchaeota archaeon]
MIEYLLLLFAIPLGFLLARITSDEKEIYTNVPYFPVLLWILLFAMVVCYFFDRQIALILTFVFITTFVWNKY